MLVTILLLILISTSFYLLVWPASFAVFAISLILMSKLVTENNSLWLVICYILFLSIPITCVLIGNFIAKALPSLNIKKAISLLSVVLGFVLLFSSDFIYQVLYLFSAYTDLNATEATAIITKIFSTIFFTVGIISIVTLLLVALIELPFNWVNKNNFDLLKFSLILRNITIILIFSLLTNIIAEAILSNLNPHGLF
jgi:hypothetical protein